MAEDQRDDHGRGVLQTPEGEFSNSCESTRLEEQDELGCAASELRLE